MTAPRVAPGDRGMTLARLPQPGRTVVVAPTGDLDAATVDALHQEVSARRREGAGHIVVDLRGVSFIDSRGLGVLLVLRNDAKREGHELTLIPGSRRVQLVFALTGTRGLFEWSSSMSHL